MRQFRYDFGDDPKNYAKRVYEVADAIDVVCQQDIAPLHDFIFDCHPDLPLICYGAGGAQSSAFAMAELCVQHGFAAQAMTPMMVYGMPDETLKKHRFMAISGGGSAHDIVAVTEKLLQIVPGRVAGLTFSDPNKRAFRKAANKVYKMVEQDEKKNNLFFNIPLKSDGFVGTRKHAAFFALAYRAFNDDKDLLRLFLDEPAFTVSMPEGREWKDITGFHLMYSPLTHSVAVDLESRFSESGLGFIMPTDMKNFTHGRHCFIARHPESCIITLETPWDTNYAEEILSLFPADTPIVRIVSPIDGDLATLDVLVRSFYFAMELADALNVNIYKPKPKPEYGGKLWGLDFRGL